MWFPLDIVMNEPICTRSRSLVLFQNERLFLFQEKKYVSKVANVNDARRLLHQRLGHTNYVLTISESFSNY
jgi:hypothetical protein